MREQARADRSCSNELGPDHPDTLTSMNNLARYAQAAGKLDLALPLYEETLKLRKAKLGPDHPDTLVQHEQPRRWLRAAGQARPGPAALRGDAGQLRKAKLGPDHPDTLISMNNLADGYRAAGKLDRALPLYEETLERNRQGKLGPDHPDAHQHEQPRHCYLAAGRATGPCRSSRRRWRR